MKPVDATRLGKDRPGRTGINFLAEDALSETDAVDLLHGYRAIHEDGEWKAALSIVRRLGGHALAVEVAAVYLSQHPDVSYRDYLTCLEEEGMLASLTGTGADRNGQLSDHPEKLIGPLLEPTLQSLNDVELRTIEYAALLPPDAVPLPWLYELVAADRPAALDSRPDDPDAWAEVLTRLSRLRLITPGDDPNLAQMHPSVQAVLAVRLEADSRKKRLERLDRVVLRRAEGFHSQGTRPDHQWEVSPLRDYALMRMAADEPKAAKMAHWIAQPLWYLTSLDETRVVLEAALACCERLVGQDPDNAEWQGRLSVSQNRVGDVQFAKDDLAGALRSYQASLDIRKGLLSHDPSNAEWQMDLSISHSKIGDVRLAEGDLAGALASYQTSRGVFERLVAQDPHNAEWQRDLSTSHNRIGDAQLAAGELAGALASFETSHELYKCLAGRDPCNAEWQRELSISRIKIGDVQFTKDDLPGALASYQTSHGVLERLVAQDPHNAEWQRDLSISHSRIGHVRLAEGDLAGALASYQTSHRILERLVAQDPHNAQWQRGFSASYRRSRHVQQLYEEAEAKRRAPLVEEVGECPDESRPFANDEEVEKQL